MRSTRFPVKKKRIKSSIKRPKLSYTKKSITPLIAVILLVVVAVILVTLILYVSKNIVLDGLDDTKEIFKEDTSLTGYVYSSNPQPDSFTVKNLSKSPIEITHYEIVGAGDSEVLNRPLPLSSSVTLNSGSSVPIPVLCSPSSSYKINLITTDGTYVSVPINNVNYQSNSCESSEVPDLVCLGVNENGRGDSSSDPIVICDVDDLNAVRNGLDKYYKLGRNLDLNVSPYNQGEGFEPIGNDVTPFTGSFDGDGRTISNLYINRPETNYVGLFGYTLHSGELEDLTAISNIGLKDVNVIGLNYVGGLAGYATKKFNLSYTTGFISGNDRVGGLVGQYNSLESISKSYSNSLVSGNTYVGGLLGYLGGFVYRCYSSGFVSGITKVGGLIGYESMFGTGILSSFYDTNTSEQSDTKGTPLTTEQMKIQSNFTNWDFETVWAIDDGVTYPYLRSITYDENNPKPQ